MDEEKAARRFLDNCHYLELLCGVIFVLMVVSNSAGNGEMVYVFTLAYFWVAIPYLFFMFRYWNYERVYPWMKRTSRKLKPC